MPEPKVIEVLWPPAGLSEQGWRQRLEDLADAAEQLVGRNVGLQQTAELGLQLVGLIWPALSPETIAASARASALLGVPVVMSTAPADQCAEIAERLDSIYAAAQDDPAAGVVEVPAPLLQVVREPDPRQGRKQRKAQPEPEPEDQQIELEPITQLSPFVDEDGDFSRGRNALPIQAIDTMALGGALPDPAQPEPPAPAPARPAAEPPPGWFTAADVAELLEVEPCSVARWRKAGRLGNEGTSWQQCGRGFYFCPDAVENIDRTRIPSGLDELVAEIQAL